MRAELLPPRGHAQRPLISPGRGPKGAPAPISRLSRRYRFLQQLWQGDAVASGRNEALLRELGIDEFIGYSKTPPE